MNHKLCSIGIGLVLAAATLAAQVIDQEETQQLSIAYKRAQPAFMKGQQLLSKGKLEKAAAKMREALEIMPEHADAHYLLGEILYRQGDFAGAAGEAQTAETNFRLISSLETIVQQIRLGRMKERRQELKDSLPPLEESLSQLRNQKGENAFVEVYRVEAQISGIRNQINQIDAQMAKPFAEGLGEPAEYHLLHGNARFKLRDFDRALEQYRLAVEINPRCGDAWNNLANIHFIRREHAAALECLEKAESSGARINPEFKAALLKALGK